MAPQPGSPTPRDEMRTCARVSGDPHRRRAPASRPPVDCRCCRFPLSNSGRSEGRRPAGPHHGYQPTTSSSPSSRGRAGGRIGAQPAQSGFCGLAPPLAGRTFRHHVAGEVFFRNLQDLLGKTDSPDLADLLEVYHLCLLLGFAGRYSLGGRGELRAVARRWPKRSVAFAATSRDLSGLGAAAGTGPSRRDRSAGAELRHRRRRLRCAGGDSVRGLQADSRLGRLQPRRPGGQVMTAMQLLD